MKEVMSSRLERVADMASRVRVKCQSLGCMDGDAIELVITEALNNTIIHAHSGMGRISIELEVERVDETIRITVQDRMNRLNEDIIKSSLESVHDNMSCSENGRGLMIMWSLVDQMEYQNGKLVMILKL